MDVALQLLQLLTVYSRMHADTPIKSRDKSLWVPTSLTHIQERTRKGGGVETAEIILFIAATAVAVSSLIYIREDTLWSRVHFNLN